jgi:2-oxoglutarate ferredoxin oxidoreductase subunit alpha
MSPEVHDRLVRRLNEKIRRAYDQIIDYELVGTEDAEIVVISFGSTARSARQAVRIARQEGMRVGVLRLITLWPFPGRVVEELSAKVRAFVVAELNLGQMAREVERFTDRPVFRANHAGGMMMPPELILASIEEAYRDAKGSRRQYASIR